jgi:hypothetical protein
VSTRNKQSGGYKSKLLQKVKAQSTKYTMGIFKDLLGMGASGASKDDIDKWASTHGYELGAGSRNAAGPQVLGVSSGVTWRMEWGTPSRDYIPTMELRVRAELAEEFRPYGLLASRRLFEVLQQRAFSLFTDSLQTMPGANLPEELRWVSILQEYPGVPQVLRPQLAVAGTPPLVFNKFWDNLMENWQQSDVLKGWDGSDNPLIVMMTRGRLYVRMSISGPTMAELEFSRALLEAVCRHLPILSKG